MNTPGWALTRGRFLFVAEELPDAITAQELVNGLWAQALALSNFKLRAAMAGYMELLCDQCSEDDAPYGHVIWSTENRGRQNYTIVELTNLCFAHEYGVHPREEKRQ